MSEQAKAKGGRTANPKATKAKVADHEKPNEGVVSASLLSLVLWSLKFEHSEVPSEEKKNLNFSFTLGYNRPSAAEVGIEFGAELTAPQDFKCDVTYRASFRLESVYKDEADLKKQLSI